MNPKRKRLATLLPSQAYRVRSFRQRGTASLVRVAQIYERITGSPLYLGFFVGVALSSPFFSSLSTATVGGVTFLDFVYAGALGPDRARVTPPCSFPISRLSWCPIREHEISRWNNGKVRYTRNETKTHTPKIFCP